MSVRLRLLVLALAPLIILMPLLLFIGMTRWTADYDNLLITNVESDLRIAEQYLNRMMESTSAKLLATARSAELLEAFASGPEARDAFLAQASRPMALEFLYFVPSEASAEEAERWPVVAEALRGNPNTQIDVMSAEGLDRVAPGLSQRARIDARPMPNDASVVTRTETRGMVLHSATPVILSGEQVGVLVGGILLNNNLKFIDDINELVFLNPITGGDRKGTVTVFLDDLRVSTNVSLFEGSRAIGTRVSEAVRHQVLEEGEIWLDRAFVVNDWYMSGYLPLHDSFGERVGMLYVGFLEAPYNAAKRAAYFWMFGAFLALLLLSAPVFLWMARGVFSPLEAMTQVMARVRGGDLTARISLSRKNDEVAQVGAHLNELLEQVQDRDRRLRAWADELNARVDQRTAELREANDKLERTFHQLLMSEKLASIGEITAGVAHEINNPVAVIQGNIDVIREVLGARAEEVRTELDLIDDQVRRIDTMVGKLLRFAQPGDYGTFASNLQLAPAVRDCLVLVEHVISRAHTDVHVQFEEVPQVRIDPGELQQIMVNLIMNAVQAMGAHGQLFLILEPEVLDGRQGVAIRVRDTGPGVTDVAKHAVFDPFFTTKPGVGTGLGLSISQNLAQRAGGLITLRNVTDAEGQIIGAEFTVWLPVAEADDSGEG
jgi:two-component system NtrC family sensor kinase